MSGSGRSASGGGTGGSGHGGGSDVTSSMTIPTGT